MISIVTDLNAVKVDDVVFYLYGTENEMFWKIPLVAGCIFAGEIVLIYFWQNYRVLLEEREKHFAEEQQIKAIKQKKQFLLIDVKNSFDGAINMQGSGQLPLSTKESDVPDIIMEHGIGLKNVSDIAERYYGGVNIRVNDKVFHITVMLQQEQKAIQEILSS